jgi:18S rRNA (adenine1779-N6/adenine1780-N6)-dimethyltransferase
MKRAVSSIRSRDVAHLAAAATAPSPAAAEAWDGRFRLHKPRGQHLLTNPRVLDAIVRRAALRPGDAVLEVGPGTGNLTVRLLESPAARVSAVEIDPRMVDAVTARVDALGLAHKLTVRLAVPTIRSIKCLQES